MRIVLAALLNALTFLGLCLTAPLRLAGRRRRPVYVHYKLSGDLPYRKHRRRRFSWPGRRDPSSVESIEGFRRQLRTLAQDASVRGIVLHLDGLHVSAAKRDALTGLLDDLRRAGKHVAGFAVSASTPEYELLCAADRIFLQPGGRLELTGYAAELSAAGGALGKAGVRAHFVRRGDYKTAPELFTRESVSEIQKESIGRFLDERYEELVALVSAGRHVTPDEARKKIDEGPYGARRALAAGLCDGVVAEADLAKELLGGEAEEDDHRLGAFADYAAGCLWPPVQWRPLRRRPRVAMVPLSGIIVPGDGAGVPGGPQLAGSDTVIRALKGAAKDPRAAAIVLFVDSPGGSALASELILDEVKRAAAKKPLLAYFDRVAASGGYMAVLGGKEIWAAPHAVAGSIGVFAGKFDASGLFDTLGIGRTLLTRGANAAMLSVSRGFTEHERASLEAEVEEIYQEFLQHVAKARSRTREEIHALAEGRIYSGKRAKDAGLVDGVSSLDAACRRAFELAGEPLAAGTDYDVALFTAAPRRFPWLALLQSLVRWDVYALWEPWISLP